MRAGGEIPEDQQHQLHRLLKQSKKAKGGGDSPGSVARGHLDLHRCRGEVWGRDRERDLPGGQLARGARPDDRDDPALERDPLAGVEAAHIGGVARTERREHPGPPSDGGLDRLAGVGDPGALGIDHLDRDVGEIVPGRADRRPVGGGLEPDGRPGGGERGDRRVRQVGASAAADSGTTPTGARSQGERAAAGRERGGSGAGLSVQTTGSVNRPNPV